jgi:hypothetical protein
MKSLLLAALAIGAWVPQSNSPINTKGAVESKLERKATANPTATLAPPANIQAEGAEQEQSSQESKAAEDQKKQEIDTQTRLVEYTRWLVVVGVIQFVALIVQAVVFFFTLRQMKDSSKRQLRAYVNISESALKLEPEDIPEGQVHIKNFGQTPAYNVREWTGIAVLPYPLTSKLPEPPEDLRRSKFVISAGGHHISVVPVKSAIPPQILPLLGTPQYTVYVYGRVVYEDIFGKQWYTEYRLICGPDGIRKKRDSKGVLMGYMRHDAEGNEAT